MKYVGHVNLMGEDEKGIIKTGERLIRSHFTK